MSVEAFVDSNVLVYAHDRGAGDKHERARALVTDLWTRRTGALSTQVIQEFYVNVRRKSANPIPAPAARQLVEDYLRWEVVVNDGTSILEALDLAARYQLSFWDALIVQAANASGAAVLLTEDLNPGQRYAAVEVANPFA
jgi:predicted nucleic acid-binding protein